MTVEEADCFRVKPTGPGDGEDLNGGPFISPEAEFIQLQFPRLFNSGNGGLFWSLVRECV